MTLDGGYTLMLWWLYKLNRENTEMNSQVIWIEVHTSKRSYAVRGGAQITWLPGEKVISMDVIK